MRETWEKEWEDTLVTENDGNDFFYEWIALESGSLEKIIKEWVMNGNGYDTKVKIKVHKGAIFICAVAGNND
jgi:hypothetical protein